MINQKKNIFFWPLFLSFLVLYFLIKDLGPLGIEALYTGGHFAFLNKLCGLTDNQSLTGYIGYLEEGILGPAAQIIAGLLLAALSLRFFQKTNKRFFAFIVFLYLIITKFEVLFFPCYGEAGAAPVAEGIWLYKHGFDYIGLFHQNNFNFGGPKAYMFSIFPTYIAFLLKITPSIRSFLLAYHLSMFALAALIISYFRSFVQKIYDSKTSLLAAILLLSLPLFQSLVELMNMEVLCLFFVMLCAYYLALKKFLPASVMAVLASLAKGPGGIACAAVFFASLILFFFDKDRNNKIYNIVCGVIVLILGAFKLYLLKTYVNPVQTTDRTIRLFIGWIPLQGSRFILFIYFLAFVSLAVTFIIELFSKEKKKESFFLRHYSVAISFIFATAWIGLYLNLSVMGPRYKLITAPFILLCGLFSVKLFIRNDKAIRGLLIIAIFLACLGSYGLYYPEKIVSDTYSFNNLERSLEYRNDLKLDRLLAETIENEYSSYTIGAPFVLAQILAMPELGYVKAPKDVVIYGMSVFYGNIKNFEGLQSMNLPMTIWIGFANRPNNYGIDFPVDPRYDKVIKNLEVGNKMLCLFQGGAGIHQMAVRFYIDQMKKIERTKGCATKIDKSSQ